MLRGNYPATVDDKGRLKIPSAYLDTLKKGGKQFFVTSENGECARVYPIKIWEAIEQKLAKLSTHNRSKQRFLDRANYYGQVVEMDGQGRILIPGVLREAAQMKGDVDVLGELSYLDVWNHTRFVENLNRNPLTDEDFKTLDSLGI